MLANTIYEFTVRSREMILMTIEVLSPETEFKYTMVTSPWQKASRLKSLNFQYLNNGIRLKVICSDDIIDVSWSQIEEVLATIEYLQAISNIPISKKEISLISPKMSVKISNRTTVTGKMSSLNARKLAIQRVFGNISKDQTTAIKQLVSLIECGNINIPKFLF